MIEIGLPREIKLQRNKVKFMTEPSSNPAIDTELLREIFGEGENLERDLLNTVCSSITQQVRGMITNLGAGNLNVIAEAGHKLKGSALSVGLTSLGNVCDEIELAAHASEADAVTSLRERFQIEADRACLALAEIQNQH